jgi:hypothetical protein
MREKPPKALEEARVISVKAFTSPPGSMRGMFLIRGPGRYKLQVLSSGPQKEGFDHVSVVVYNHLKITPSWEEMVFIKDLFFAGDETVVQYHPPADQYINHHPGCLHLWKPPYPLPLPSSAFLGNEIKTVIPMTEGPPEKASADESINDGPGEDD